MPAPVLPLPAASPVADAHVEPGLELLIEKAGAWIEAAGVAAIVLGVVVTSALYLWNLRREGGMKRRAGKRGRSDRGRARPVQSRPDYRPSTDRAGVPRPPERRAARPMAASRSGRYGGGETLFSP